METKNFKLNITINKQLLELEIPVESNMKLVDFIMALQMLIKKIANEAVAIDIYDLQFQRIALIDDELDIYIEEEYDSISTVKDLYDVCVETLEIIVLGNRPIRKILQEEEMLKYALDNYNIDENGI